MNIQTVVIATASEELSKKIEEELKVKDPASAEEEGKECTELKDLTKKKLSQSSTQ